MFSPLSVWANGDILLGATTFEVPEDLLFINKTVGNNTIRVHRYGVENAGEFETYWRSEERRVGKEC